jgi:hypothetical protein
MNIAEYVARSRSEQGLEPRITDPIVLSRIALLLTTARHAQRSEDAARPGSTRAEGACHDRAVPNG